MNCGAFQDELLVSHLFGHEKGSFTGATERRVGVFEQAHRGTLFLDEVANLSRNTRANAVEDEARRVLARGEDRLARQVLARGLCALETRRQLEQELDEARRHVARLLAALVRAENRAWGLR